MKCGTDKVVPESCCTACGHAMDRATSVGRDYQPKPGDFTICIRCGHLMAFTEDLTLRNLADSEIHEAAGDPRVLALQAARRK